MATIEFTTHDDDGLPSASVISSSDELRDTMSPGELDSGYRSHHPGPSDRLQLFDVSARRANVNVQRCFLAHRRRDHPAVVEGELRAGSHVVGPGGTHADVPGGTVSTRCRAGPDGLRFFNFRPHSRRHLLTARETLDAGRAENRPACDRFVCDDRAIARRPAGGRPAAPAGPRPGHRGRGGGGARGVGAHRPPRPRGARHGGPARLLPPGPQRRLAAARRRPDRPQRADRGRGPGPVPGGRAVLVGHPRDPGRAAQAGAGAARVVPRRGRGRLGRGRGRPARLGPHRLDPARRRRCSTRCSRRSSTACSWRSTTWPGTAAPATGSCTRSASSAKGQSWYLVAETEAGLAHVPGGPPGRRRADRRAGGPPRGLRPRADVVADQRRGRRAAGAGAGPGAGRPQHPRGCAARCWAPGCGSGRARPTAASCWSSGATPRAPWPARSPASAPLLEVLEPPEIREQLAAIGAELSPRTPPTNLRQQTLYRTRS